MVTSADLPHELQEFRDTLHRFVANEVEPYAEEIERTNDLPDALLKRAAELGLCGLSIPEEFGGMGESELASSVAVETLSHGPGGVTFYLAPSAPAAAIRLAGTDEQRQRYLPQLASGETFAAFCLSEAGAGSDAAGIKARAVRQGDKWIINGSKLWISRARRAGVFLVSAVTDPSKRGAGAITVFIVDKRKGVNVGEPDRLMGLAGSGSAEVSFQDVEATDADVLGKVGGGIVIVQVKRLARAGSLDPRLVRIPGALVDAIVLHPAQKQLCESMADPLHGWNPFLAGALKASYRGLPPLSDPAQRIMMRRAALELRPWHVVNLGAGVATQLPRIALEEGILEKVVFTNEHGIFGGLMATALGGSFVPALNADAIMDSAFQFNFYESGGLNVNVEEGRLRILKEGKFRKFVPQVEQITLNADRAWSRGQRVMYITERAVFERDAQGMVLTEVAPGIDVQKEIAAVVGFPLRVSENLKTMDERIFTQKSMGLECEFNEEEQ